MPNPRRRMRFASKTEILISLWIVFPEPAHTVELHIAGHYLVARAFANGALVSEVPRPGGGIVGLPGNWHRLHRAVHVRQLPGGEDLLSDRGDGHRLHQHVRAQPQRLRRPQTVGQQRRDSRAGNLLPLDAAASDRPDPQRIPRHDGVHTLHVVSHRGGAWSLAGVGCRPRACEQRRDVGAVPARRQADQPRAVHRVDHSKRRRHARVWLVRPRR